MSILNSVTPPTPTPCMVAGMLKARARATYEMLVRTFNDGAKQFWDNPNNFTPEAIAACLGTDAREVFELHGKIGALLSEINPAALAPGLAVVGAFSYNEDGTVNVAGATPAESSSSAG